MNMNTVDAYEGETFDIYQMLWWLRRQQFDLTDRRNWEIKELAELMDGGTCDAVEFLQWLGY